MVALFGHHLSRAELARRLPDIAELAGIRHLSETDGTGRGQRVLQVETGGGLRIDLLPDRCCDIGRAWAGGVPFGWIGAMGVPDPASIKDNTSLSGLLTTCGFDHIRQPEDDEGRHYPMHGGMLHMPARLLSAEPVWMGDECVFRIVAEATQMAFDRGVLRLRRHLYLPLGGRSLLLFDRVTVMAGSLPIMAMYHFNFGFPLVSDTSVLTLGRADITAETLGSQGARTRSSGTGEVVARLAGSPDGPAIGITYSSAELPIFQTFRVAVPGIELLSLEPATHERLPRAALRRSGTLTSAQTGETRAFALDLAFMPSSSAPPEAAAGLAAACRLRQVDAAARG